LGPPMLRLEPISTVIVFVWAWAMPKIATIRVRIILGALKVQRLRAWPANSGKNGNTW
jgi:hypothetical protein